MVATTLSRGRPRLRKILVDGAAQLWQGVRELDQIAVFHLVAAGGPALVIAVLLAPANIAARHLDVAIGTRRDPDIGPGRRNDQRANAGKVFLVAQLLAGRGAVVEPFAGADAPKTRLGIVAVAQ